jgi:uncharacterized protein
MDETAMVRLLFWIAVIAIAVWLWRRYKRANEARSQTRTMDEPSPMVRCDTCGVHVPQQQALPLGRKWYCSQAHLPASETPGDR